MRILHFSDTHLGYQAFDPVNESGVNTREQDVYNAFEQIVNRILDIKPDAVIHSGDFFHRPSPSNRALTFGLEQLRRIGQAGIPTIVIAGNHETPKTIYNSPILRAMRTLDHVYPIFGEQWETVSIGKIAIHGVPHINDNRLLFKALEDLTPVADHYNILMLHTSLGKRYLMEEYGEQVFPAAFEEKLLHFQYIALGHWHNCQQIDVHPNAWYAGSIERLSDTEIGSDKGFLCLDIAPDFSSKVTFESVQTRPWLKWERKGCHEVSVMELEVELADWKTKNDCNDAIISLYFQDIRPEQTLDLGNARLRQLFPEAFQLVVKRRTWSDSSFVQGIEANQFDSLDAVFADYLHSKYSDDKALADQLVARANDYFQTAKL